MATRLKRVHGRSVTLARNDFETAQISQLQAELVSYLARVLAPGYTVSEKSSLHDALVDGQALCHFASLLTGRTIKCNTKKEPFFVRENIESFISNCRKLGFPETVLFSPGDVVDGRNMRLVTTCLVYAAKKAERIGINAEIPAQEFEFLDEVRAEIEKEEEIAANSMAATPAETVSAVDCNADANTATVSSSSDSTTTETTATGASVSEEQVPPKLFSVGNDHHTSTKLDLPASLDSSIVKIACGFGHTLALTASGAVYSRGTGAHGRLGHGTHASEPQLRRIEALDGHRIVDIACGTAHSLCVDNAGTVFAFGFNGFGQCGAGSSEDVLLPQRIDQIHVEDLQEREVGRITQVCCGAMHSLLLSEDGLVLACGNNESGQLGLGDADSRNRFTLVPSLTGNGWNTPNTLYAGYGYSMVRTKTGVLLAAGAYLDGMSVPMFVPIEETSSLQADHVSAGPFHFCVAHGEKVHFFGRADRGRFESFDRNAVSFDAPVAQVALGHYHAVVLLQDGRVFAWGTGSNGQLGFDMDEKDVISEFDRSTFVQQRPRQVLLPDGTVPTVLGVACGEDFTVFWAK
jgi:hypothetical protein